jgi:hypothetical protein
VLGNGSENQKRRRDWALRKALSRPQFSAEALALFVELEDMPRTDEFKIKGARLAELLGLTDEWWTCNHVHDRSTEPCYPPGYPAREDWFRVHDVRRMLLAATGLSAQRKKRPATA